MTEARPCVPAGAPPRRAPRGPAIAALRGVAVVAALLVGACSQIPEYQRPAPPVPPAFPAAADGARDAASLPWREVYTDPTLRALIEAALENNRDLRIAVARVAEARAQSGIVRADRLPTIDGTAQQLRSRTPADASGVGVTRTFSRYDLALGMSSFELDFWGRVAALDEAARSQYLASEAAAAAFRIGLIGDVANTWLLYGELAQRERLAEATLSGRVAGRDLLAKRRDAGVTTDLDVLAAEGIVESVRAQIAELRRQRAQTANALRLLTGATGELPAPPGADAPPLVADFAPGLPSEVLVRRPDVRAAEERLIASNANVGAARAAFFPRVGITLTGGLAGGSIDGLFDAGSGAWIWQPVIRLPIFDSGRLQSNLDLAEARKVAAVADYERTIQQAFREVSDLLAARSTLAEQVAAQEANLAAQRQRLARVLARYRAGLSNYLEVLDAEREVFVYEQAVVVTRRQMQAVAVGMYKALGTD